MNAYTQDASDFKNRQNVFSRSKKTSHMHTMAQSAQPGFFSVLRW